MPRGKYANEIDTRLYFLGCIIDRMRVAAEHRGWGDRNSLGGLAAGEFRWLQVPRSVWALLREPVEHIASLSDLRVELQEPYWVTHAGHSPVLPGHSPVLPSRARKEADVPDGNVAIAFKKRTLSEPNRSVPRPNVRNSI